MRFGLALPHYDFSGPDPGPVTFDRLAEIAKLAERLGFSSVWISDHFFLRLTRYGGGPEVQGSTEPMVALAGLAMATERVRLGTLVLCSSFRHPGIVAKMATAVDLLSGGRLDLGIGAGWYQEEYEAFGYPYGSVRERFEVLEETLEVLGLLFGDGPATFQGKHFRLDGAYNRPAPEGRPPIWLGAKGGPRALRLAARHADGWNTVWRWTVPDYAELVAEARRICEQEGRDPGTLRLSVGLYSLVGEDRADLEARYAAMQRWAPGAAIDAVSLDEWATGALVGTPEEVRETVGQFEELGVEELIVSLGPLPFSVYDRSAIEALAEAVMANTSRP
ncbi:MAG: LLM class flavin-dependent oxidoreductase [Actinomycetota bacterium]|nr:LLM class flavin-dependent oxidoreductase [Actinomycetota bacterium]